MILDKLGGRKFVGFIIISILLTILVGAGKLGVDTFTTFISANFALFVVGNAVENATSKS